MNHTFCGHRKMTYILMYYFLATLFWLRN